MDSNSNSASRKGKEGETNSHSTLQEQGQTGKQEAVAQQSRNKNTSSNFDITPQEMEGKNACPIAPSTNVKNNHRYHQKKLLSSPILCKAGKSEYTFPLLCFQGHSTLTYPRMPPNYCCSPTPPCSVSISSRPSDISPGLTIYINLTLRNSWNSTHRNFENMEIAFILKTKTWQTNKKTVSQL